MKNEDYWRQRFELLEEAQNNQRTEYLDLLKEEYEKSLSRIEKDITNWYTRIANNNEISFDNAKKLLDKKELKEFKWTVEEYIKKGRENAIDQRWIKELENASARVHIDKLEAIKIQIQNELEQLSAKQNKNTTDLLKNQYENAYYKSSFEIQKGLEKYWNIQPLDTDKINNIITKPWTTDNKTFSDRIWQNKESLINTLQKHLVQSTIRGEDILNVINKIEKDFKVSKHKVGTLIMTESAFFSSAGQKECFNSLNVKQYEIIVTLDSHTSEICQKLDGKVFDMKDYEVGITAPPFHVNCRSTTAPYFDDEFTEGEQRAYRAEDGKTKYVDSKIKYKEWYEKYVNTSTNSNNGVIIQNKKILSLDECKQIIEEQNIKFCNNNLKQIDSNLLSENTQQLNELIEKYSTMKQYIKARNVKFNALSLSSNTVAQVSTDVELENIEISLSKSKYKNYNDFIEIEEKELEINHCMERSNKYKSTYTITHEFGHLIESSFIDEYNKNHLAEFYNMKTKALNAKTATQSKKIIRNWESKIANNIAQEIYEIAKNNNPNFDLAKQLSQYGKENSFEFFAECFANAECGKPNELGKAIKQYLKKRGL